MLAWRRPGDEAIRAYLQRQARERFSYAQVGATRKGADALRADLGGDFAVHRDRIRLGAGAELYRRARACITDWAMFRLPWVELCWPGAPLRVGTTVGVLARALGLWVLNPCRIVYLVDEEGDPARFGFAYGTLPDHAARGEELFQVEWQRSDDTVWYERMAFSRPNGILPHLGTVYLRRAQRRFGTGSVAAVRRAVQS
ncbi:MAG: DUF1990 domain-containing protein [Proteobacteria bacterium]|nr:DUF1990 domain-containing protein [Pseudomonadota bacterium]